MTRRLDAVALAKWQEVQEDLRHLSLQRSLRFVAAAVLAPFGVSGVGRDADAAGPALSSLAFGIALLLLAVGEMTSIGVSGLLARQRKDMEATHPALAPKGNPGRLARFLTIVSGPGLSTSLYALLGAAFVAGRVMGVG